MKTQIRTQQPSRIQIVNLGFGGLDLVEQEEEMKFVDVAGVVDLGLGVWIGEMRLSKGESGGVGGVDRLEARQQGLDSTGRIVPKIVELDGLR